MISEKTNTLGREVARATPTSSPERDVLPKQGFLHKLFKKDILTAVHVEGENRGVYILEGSQWVKQIDVPKDLAEHEVFFCAMSGGLLAMGGKISTQNSRVCYHYSPFERKWTKLPDMITPKNRAQAVEVKSKFVMVVGGFSDKGSFSNKCEILDIKRGEWSSVTALPKHIKGVRAAATEKRVFIIGQSGDSYAPNYELLEYHPSTDEYTTMETDMPRVDTWKFYASDMAAVEDKLYLVGEINMECDVTTQHFTPLPPKPKISHSSRLCCATVRGKKILLCGGQDDDHFYNAIEEYKTKTRQWKMMDVSLPFTFSKSASFLANITV